MMYDSAAVVELHERLQQGPQTAVLLGGQPVIGMPPYAKYIVVMLRLSKSRSKSRLYSRIGKTESSVSRLIFNDIQVQQCRAWW